jgi:hypothetical protein
MKQIVRFFKGAGNFYAAVPADGFGRVRHDVGKHFGHMVSVAYPKHIVRHVNTHCDNTFRVIQENRHGFGKQFR